MSTLLVIAGTTGACVVASFFGCMTNVKRFGIVIRNELFPGTSELAYMAAAQLSGIVAFLTCSLAAWFAPEWLYTSCAILIAASYVLGCVTYPNA